MSRKSKYSSSGGSHLKGNNRRDVPYYEKNQSAMGRARARKAHKVGTEMFSQYDTSAIRPKKRHTGRNILIVVVIVIVLAIGGYLVYDRFFSEEVNSDVTAGVEVEVTIPDGATTTDIADLLFASGVIYKESAFIKAVQSADADSSLKPGTYSLTTLMDTDELIETLVEGVTFTGTKLTVPEGLTISEVAELVETTTGISADEFVTLAYSASSYVDDYAFLADVYDDSMEGFLFPKTYDVQDDATADTVIRMMLDQFGSEIESAGISTDGANGYSLYELVTIASLIQEETPNTEEMATVSSVIYNRLSIGMRLQFDSTVVYALGDDYSGDALTYSDLEVDSPYNTYVTDGLPAGPIDSPSIDAIIAAANPESTDYLYFLGEGDDTTHQFFEDYDSFLEAKNG